MAVRRKLPGLFDPDQDFTGDLLGVSIPEIPMLGESQPKIGAVAPTEEIPPRPGEWLPDPTQPRRRPVPAPAPPPKAPEVPPEAPPEPPEVPPETQEPIPPPPPLGAPAVPAQAPLGFDPTKWANAAHQTPKYVVGRLVASYGGDVAAAMPAIQALFPGARLVGDDKIDFGPPLGIIDVRTGAGAAWWYPVSPGAPGAPGGTQTAPSAGGAPSGFDIGTLLDLIRQAETFAGPQGPGVFQDSAQLPGQFDDTPVQQVGQDPFSQLASGGLASLLGALSGPGGAEAALLERGRSDTIPEDVLNRRMESAREAAERIRRSEIDTLRAGLAERNLISVPGAPQGAEKTGMERISDLLAERQFGTLRDVASDLMQQYSGESLSALQTAAAAGNVRAQNILETLVSMTDRQQMLSEIALGTLDRNMAWNKFLAEFGLNRDQVMEELRAGRIAMLYPLINQFLQSAGIAAGGFV